MRDSPMISKFHPVTGLDLEALRSQPGMLVADFCTLLGISMRKWGEMQKNPDEPVPDATIALLARSIDATPELAWVPIFPSAQEVYNKVSEVASMRREGVSHKQFSVANGRDGTSSYRWLKYGQSPGPFVNRTLWTLRETLNRRGYEGWAEWQELVDAEAQA